MKELFLLRGLPGAGKSTLAESLTGGSFFEADLFFLDKRGEYQFDASKLKDAHKWCQDRVEAIMKGWGNVLPANRIVVSNTFTQAWEMQPYYDLAEKYGYRVYSLIVENRHGGVNEHGVPEEKLQQMKNRFQVQLLPVKEIKLEDVFNDKKKEKLKEFIDQHKQETLNEVALEFAKDHHEMYETSNLGSMHFGFCWGAKWQQERSYSEEEVIDIAKQAFVLGKDFGLIGTFNEWFEQFKKK